MSNSTVRLYDLLKAEYPGQVYLGQIAQSVDIQSTTGVILLETISEDASGNKDGAKRDKIVYNVHVIGLLQKTIDSLAKDIRDLVEPYNDEYIYLMEYTGTQRDRDDTGEVFRNILSFTCWNNGDGLNTPTGYWEHLVRFYENSGTPQYEVLNQNELNYLPMVWGYGSYPGYYIWSVNDNTFLQNDIEFYQQLPNDGSLVNDTSVVCSVDARINVAKQGFGDTFDNCIILIRIRKSAIGSIGGS